MSKMNNSTKTILWAVDLPSGKENLQHTAFKTLSALSHNGKLVIEPVHVMNTVEEKRITEESMKWLMKIKLPGLTPPVLLARKGVYLRSDIDTLMSYGKKKEVECIVVNTHARTGLPRFWMGSFAETLLFHSEIPVLFVNPHTKAPSRINSILFPTNLGQTSRKHFENILSFASLFKLDVVLYHRLKSYAEVTGLPLLKPDVKFKNERKNETEKAQALLSVWAQDALDKGVKVEVLVDSVKNSVTDGILSHAKSMKTGIVAMGAEKGPLESMVIGSTTRKIVRLATAPVLVVREK